MTVRECYSHALKKGCLLATRRPRPSRSDFSGETSMMRTDRRADADGITNGGDYGYETHFGLGAKVDLIELCQSASQSVSKSVSDAHARPALLADFIFRFFGAQTLASFSQEVRSRAVFALIDNCSSRPTDHLWHRETRSPACMPAPASPVLISGWLAAVY